MYTITVSPQAMQTIVNVLVQLPYAQSANIIADIQAQVRQQEEARAIPVDASGEWEAAARNVLPPEDFERLKERVELGAAA